MPIEQNIPAAIRNWAYCLVEIQRYEAVVPRLDSGCRISIGTHGIYKSLAGGMAVPGRKSFWRSSASPKPRG